MERIPFDIKFRPEIEARQLLVETRDGNSVKIICWDRKNYRPIIALLGSTEMVCAYTEKGKYDDLKESIFDLVLAPNPDHNEPAVKPSVSVKPAVDWNAFRRVAAKDMLCAIFDRKEGTICEQEVEAAIYYTDELIKQLKEGKK